MFKAVGTGGEGGAVKTRSQQPHLDEVVEVSGLQRSILPVVREAQHLPRMSGERAVLAQPTYRGEAERRGGGASAAAGQRGQFAVVGLPTGIGNAAVEAEAKGGNNEVHPHAIRRLDAQLVCAYGFREHVATIPLHLRLAVAALLDPIFRDALEKPVVQLVRPRVVVIHIQESCRAVVIIAPVRQFPATIAEWSVVRFSVTINEVLFLATFPAET